LERLWGFPEGSLELYPKAVLGTLFHWAPNKSPPKGGLVGMARNLVAPKKALELVWKKVIYLRGVQSVKRGVLLRTFGILKPLFWGGEKMGKLGVGAPRNLLGRGWIFPRE